MDNMEREVGLKKLTEVFNSASRDIFNQMTRLSVKRGETFVRKRSYPSYEYSFIVGVTGQYKGAVIMSLKEETALFLVSTMLGKKAQSIDEMAESALKELVNITVGQALTISGSDEPLDITPPTFVKGSNISMAVSDVQESHVTTFVTEVGVVEFTLSLETGGK